MYRLPYSPDKQKTFETLCRKIPSTIFVVFFPPLAEAYGWAVHLDAIKRAFGRACHDVVRHHTLQVSAALSYYFVLAVFPSLIVLSAVLGFVPLHLFSHVQYLLDRLLPADTMQIITPVLNDVLLLAPWNVAVIRNAGDNLGRLRGLRLTY